MIQIISFSHKIRFVFLRISGTFKKLEAAFSNQLLAFSKKKQ